MLRRDDSKITHTFAGQDAKGFATPRNSAVVRFVVGVPQEANHGGRLVSNHPDDESPSVHPTAGGRCFWFLLLLVFMVRGDLEIEDDGLMSIAPWH